MYARYMRTQVGAHATRYEFQERASLFGCNNGFTPKRRMCWNYETANPAFQPTGFNVIGPRVSCCGGG